MKAMFATALDDMVVRRQLGQVLNMLKPLSAFFELPIISRVARNALRRRFSQNGIQAIPDRPPIAAAAR